MKRNRFAPWAGTEDSYHALAEQEEKVKDPAYLVQLKAAALEDGAEKVEDDSSYLLQRDGQIAILNVKGSMTKSDAWYNQYIGRVGYGDIRQALIEAATDPTISTIVMDIDSGGGDAYGINELATFVREVDANYKPVLAYTSGLMCSAAYWLGSAARHVYAGNMARVGSIGVIAMHADYSKALENEGVKMTVLRVGEFKALGSPYETLSDKAYNTLMDELQGLNNYFESAIAENRGQTKTYVRTVAGQGRVFFGDDAIEVGLVDGVVGFDDLLKNLHLHIDNSVKSVDYSRNLITGQQMKVRKTLMAQAAAVAANAAVAQAIQTEVAEAPAMEDPAVAALAMAAQAEAAEAEGAQAAAEGAVASAEDEGTAISAEASIVAEQLDQTPSAVAVLQEMLTKAQAEHITAVAELKSKEAALEAQAAEVTALKNIVANACAHLQVALGGNKELNTEMSTGELVAHHASLSERFKAKFKSGGVAANASSEPSGEAVDVLRAARLQATRHK